MTMVTGKPYCIDSVRCRWNALGCPEITDTTVYVGTGWTSSIRFDSQQDMFVIRHLEGTLLPWGFLTR